MPAQKNYPSEHSCACVSSCCYSGFFKILFVSFVVYGVLICSCRDVARYTRAKSANCFRCKLQQYPGDEMSRDASYMVTEAQFNTSEHWRNTLEILIGIFVRVNERCEHKTQKARREEEKN